MPTTASPDGSAIAYDRRGNGPPVIIVDGAFCHRSFGPSSKLAACLAEHFTVLTYDRRGRGSSTDRAPYAVDREVEDLAAVLDVAGGSGFICGLSSGAALALRAVAEGLPATKLALFEPPFVGVHHDARPPADAAATLDAFLSAGRRGDAAVYFQTEVLGMPRMVVRLMRLVPGMWSKTKAVAPTLAYELAIMDDWALPRERIRSLNVPVLVASGEKSPAALQHAAQAVVDASPVARHRVLEGQSHNVSMPLLAEVLTEFFME